MDVIIQIWKIVNGVVKKREAEVRRLPKQAHAISHEEEEKLLAAILKVPNEGERLNYLLFLLIGLDWSLRGGAYHALKTTDMSTRLIDGKQVLVFIWNISSRSLRTSKQGLHRLNQHIDVA